MYFYELKYSSRGFASSVKTTALLY